MAGGNAQRFPDQRISRSAAEAELAMLLVNCTDARLASHTVDSLGAINRTPKPRIAEMLDAERRRRG